MECEKPVFSCVASTVRTVPVVGSDTTSPIAAQPGPDRCVVPKPQVRGCENL